MVWNSKGFGGQGQDQLAECEPSVDLSMESKWYGIPKEYQGFQVEDGTNSEKLHPV